MFSVNIGDPFFIVNVITFLAFGFDKVCAKTKNRRLSEAVLLFLFFVGTLGSTAAMLLFQHKTSKVSFEILIGLLLRSNVIYSSNVHVPKTSFVIKVFAVLIDKIAIVK